MNLAYVHLLLNHLPIIGTLITLGLFIVSLVAKREELRQISLAMFALIALLTIPTYMSGSAAQDAIKDHPGVSMALIEAHQGAALLAFLLMEITGVVSLVALWHFSRTGKNPGLAGQAQM